jgi:hypothetical protein
MELRHTEWGGPAGCIMQAGNLLLPCVRQLILVHHLLLTPSSGVAQGDLTCC